MSTPTLVSRYPRPLRAMHESFQSQQQGTQPLPPVSSYSSSSSTTASSSVPIRSTQKHSHATDPPQNHSPAQRDSFTEEVAGLSLSPPSSPLLPMSVLTPPRRANSLTSLLDTTSQQYQFETQVDMDCDVEHHHRRSNSLSNAESIKKLHGYVNKSEDQHSRRSIEGLNQEVSSFFEGMPEIYTSPHPDGHIAPVQDSPSTRATLGLSVTPQDVPLSPSRLYSSPSSSDRSCHFSPRQAFAHAPPATAERCKIVQEGLSLSTDFVPIPPDQTKANIVFNGSVFAPPLLPSHGLKPMTII
ncbi:PREDICTED: uncharacterized protein LOC100632821 [Amphimedon queenslandica]|uniref:Uncharacterized protein n=1 Tax=Amphimedon queenslandica TaxID=400682 RepID=A0A1X7VQR0_AMPQE|nr:PREDICTED: uncharacterized protein LOC100632821 [Amphimedon queenslandica]|eukprot:XP_003383147.1 PREDICTED: uncharacterized protein LOC100632821 [Amphimedon queenslandica]